MLRKWIVDSGISPKLVGTVALAVLASVAIWLITGDESYLIAILVVFVGAGYGAMQPAAFSRLRQPDVTQSEAQRLADKPLSQRRS